jgi:hypothetical protein
LGVTTPQRQQDGHTQSQQQVFYVTMIIVDTELSSHLNKAIPRDWDQELIDLWKKHLNNIDSKVLCESTGVKEWLIKIESKK